jgi:5-deoxy-glucuronate isomerase
MMLIRNNILLNKATADAVYQHVSCEKAGWKYLNFQARKMIMGDHIQGDTGENEYLFVVLGGDFYAETSRDNWETKNGRKDVFSGLPHALYLPPHTTYTLTAKSKILDIAVGWCPATENYNARLITPEDVNNNGIEYRGGDNASRQINSLLPPGSDCHRLVCVEVYTPSGNWSSFPAHKHDNRKIDPHTGAVSEAELEEFYFYKIDKPQGFAIQKIYTDNRDLDELVEARNNDLVLIPRGYHPVVAGHGYNVYYLNFLAGSDQSLANSDDPDHKWIYGSWEGLDHRLPVVSLGMNKDK